MALCLTRRDVSTGEQLAATYDSVMGGDDSAVGCNMTLLIRRSSDPRDYTERVVIASDLLRQATRTVQ